VIDITNPTNIRKYKYVFMEYALSGGRIDIKYRIAAIAINKRR